MKITTTNFPGLLVIEPKVIKDERGFFFESYNHQLHQKNGLDYNWVQDNRARSQYGVIRGLHFQLNPVAQAKLVSVSLGAVIDSVVDLRKGSPTYGHSFSIELSAANKKQLLVPRGFAHGYSVITKVAEFQYKCDNYYSQSDERGIHPVNNGFNIDWKINPSNIQLSEKDKNAPDFDTCEHNFDHAG